MSLAVSQPRTVSQSSVITAICCAAFVYILYDVVVAFFYETSESLATFESGEALDGSAGNPFRQLIYAIVILMSFVALASTKRVTLADVALAIPLSYTIAIIWALMSSQWAIAPAISLRRAILMAAILLPIGIIIRCLGTRMVVQLLYGAFVAILFASLISVALNSVPLFAFSIHPQNELDPAVAGAWKGVFSHKNGAGPVMVHAAILFLFHFFARRKLQDIVLFALCVFFVFGTKSKTSIALLFACIAVGYVFFLHLKSRASLLWHYITLFVVVSASVIAWTLGDEIARYFSDTANLTGRVGIWTSMVPFIKEHLWLGSGYGSFWGIGDNSPIYSLAIERYILRLGTSHNGFIEILVTTGVVGFALVIVALVIIPYIRFTRAPPNRARTYAMFFTMWLFGILQNFSESQIFSPEKQSWIFVVIAMFCVYNEQRQGLARTAPR